MRWTAFTARGSVPTNAVYQGQCTNVQQLHQGQCTNLCTRESVPTSACTGGSVPSSVPEALYKSVQCTRGSVPLSNKCTRGSVLTSAPERVYQPVLQCSVPGSVYQAPFEIVRLPAGHFFILGHVNTTQTTPLHLISEHHTM